MRNGYAAALAGLPTDGSVEVMPTPAAVRRAQGLGLDLILIAPTAEPPIAKAMDYDQWQQENRKKQGPR